MTLTQGPLLHHYHHQAREITYWKTYTRISLHLPLALRTKSLTISSLLLRNLMFPWLPPQSTEQEKHPPQPVEGFADSFSSGHPASALPTEVTSNVIPAVDQGIPPVCSPDPFGAPRFVHRTSASSHPRPPSQYENEKEDTAAPKTSQPNSRHQRTDSFGLTPFVEQGSEVKGQPPKVSSEVKGQPLPSANRPEPVYATMTKKTAKQEDSFGLYPFTAEGRQHSSPNPAYTASQRPPQSAPHQSPAATTRVPPHSNLDRSLNLFEPEPVRPGATKQTPRGDQQGVQYHSSSPWQQGADCFGAIPFVSMAAKDN